MKAFLLLEHLSERCNNYLSNENELIQDLNLHVIFEAMSSGDSFLYDTSKSVVLDSLTDINTILYRQNILKDCINKPSQIQQIYKITSEALNSAAYYRLYTKPNYARIIPAAARVVNSVGLLEILILSLEELRQLLYSIETDFESKGMRAFCSRFSAHLTDNFFIEAKEYIKDLKNLTEGGSVIIGSEIGNGLKGTKYILRAVSGDASKPPKKRLLSKACDYNEIPVDSISLANSAGEIKNAGLIHLLRVINHFTEIISNFFEELRYEIGFYTGCLNLYKKLSDIGADTAFPIPESICERTLVFNGLYDLCLTLSESKTVVSNNLEASGKCLFIITGANQGGKSTFLRSVGIAQMLMQCGLFVPAAYYRANVCDKIFTHFTREEDASMNSGKLDEELLRMKTIINNITLNSLLLMNEPFATTTEREGSIIAADIITALYELNIKVLFVTHLFEFSNSMFERNLEKSVFLRAGRNDNGDRSYFIKVGQPLRTSYGEDLFKSVLDRVY